MKISQIHLWLLILTLLPTLTFTRLSYAETSETCSDLYVSVLNKTIELSAKASEVKGLLLSKPTDEWYDGFTYFTKEQLKRMDKLEKLSPLEKKSLLVNLLEDPSFKKSPESYQRLVLMSLNDEASWDHWITAISDHGMNTKTVDYFQNKVSRLPDSLRDHLLTKISQTYENKYASNGSSKILQHYKFGDPITNLIPEDRKLEYNQLIKPPKRIYDQLIPELTGGVRNLWDSLKSGEPTLKAYDKYLAELRIKMNQTRPDYNAEDVHAAGLAIQKKLRELASDPHYQESSWLMGKRKAYVVIYGSFPNGRANFSSGSDLDMAVSYAKLATGEISKDKPPLSFERPDHMGTWDMEDEAMKVLKDRLKLGTTYQPEDHGYVTEKHMHEAGLDQLSPIRLKVTEDSIEIEIDNLGKTQSFKF